MKELTKQISILLKNSFQYFFKHAIDHLLQESTDYNKTMFVFSVQQALELLVKLYLINYHGVLSILDDKQIYDSTKVLRSEDELLDLLRKQNLRTKNYNELLKNIEKDSNLTNSEKKLLKSFQLKRNQIVHMGLDSFSTSITSEVNLLIASIFNKLEYKENTTQNNDMENTLQKLLGTKLFDEYLTKTTIIKDTEKFININYEPKDICYCLECGHETSIYEWEEFRCYLCGYKMQDYYVGIMKCPNCFRRAFYYDKLNTTKENDTIGNCSVCDSSFTVSKCKKCNDFFIPDVTECSCNKKNKKLCSSFSHQGTI